MNNKKDFLSYITRSKILKNSDIQIIIPTFNSYEVTRNTIKKIYQQKKINFDVLVIDNNSKDYERLIVDFPDINYILLKENTGSSGAQYIGAQIALQKGYDFIIFTDNDALLLQDDALITMFDKLKSNENIGAVVPKNIDWNYRQKNDFYLTAKAFHYLFAKSEIIKKTGLHNFYIFLYADDAALTLKISKISKILCCCKVYYYHYVFSPGLFKNFYYYFYLRGLLILIFKEKNILIRHRFKYFIVWLYKVAQMLFFALRFLDFSYIRTIILSFIGFFKINEDFKSVIPGNKYILKEVDFTNQYKFVDISNRWRRFFLPKYCFVYSNYLNKNIYFKIERNEQ